LPARGGVELGHELAVGGAGGAEFLVAFFEREAQADVLLLQAGGLLAELVEVGALPEATGVPGLLGNPLEAWTLPVSGFL
jgi:hypothetical protein